jgi:hypothetical protein
MRPFSKRARYMTLETISQMKRSACQSCSKKAYRCHPHSRAPASLCAAIYSLVCRVSTSLREGLIGCVQCSHCEPADHSRIQRSR